MKPIKHVRVPAIVREVDAKAPGTLEVEVEPPIGSDPKSVRLGFKGISDGRLLHEIVDRLRIGREVILQVTMAASPTFKVILDGVKYEVSLVA